MAASDVEFREALLARKVELDEQDARTVDDRAPVALQQDSVGRLSRMDAMQVQAMALAQERRRNAERGAINPARLANNPTVVKCLDCASEA